MLIALKLFMGTPTGRTFAKIGAVILGLSLLLTINGRRVRKMERAKSHVKDLERSNEVRSDTGAVFRRSLQPATDRGYRD